MLQKLRERVAAWSGRTEFAVVTLICFGYFAVASVAVLVMKIQRAELTTGRALRSTAIEVAILFVAGWILRVRGWRFRELGGRPAVAGFLAGIPLAIAYLVLSACMYWLALWLSPGIARMQFFRITVTAAWPVMLLYLVVNSVFEEFAVTGYVVRALERDGAAFAITASALIRFVYHLYQGPIASIVILPLGFLFGAVYWRWRTLWPLIVAHTLVNVMSMMFGK